MLNTSLLLSPVTAKSYFLISMDEDGDGMEKVMEEVEVCDLPAVKKKHSRGLVWSLCSNKAIGLWYCKWQELTDGRATVIYIISLCQAELWVNSPWTRRELVIILHLNLAVITSRKCWLYFCGRNCCPFRFLVNLVGDNRSIKKITKQRDSCFMIGRRKYPVSADSVKWLVCIHASSCLMFSRRNVYVHQLSLYLLVACDNVNFFFMSHK